MFRLFKYISWINFYSQTTSIEEYKWLTFSSGNQTLSPKSSNTYVFNCLFIDMYSTSSGGAISCSNKQDSLLIEQCSFYNCSSNTYQGAIRATNGNCIIAQTCAQFCCAEINDGFCSITKDDYTEQSNREINSVFDSSISRCDAKSKYTMAHTYGKIEIKSVNLSHNRAEFYSAIALLPNNFVEGTEYGCIVSYCSFSNNTATIEQCIRMNNYYNPSCKHQIKTSNIIDNNSPNTIWSQGETKITLCSIMNNVNPCFFPQSSSSSITLIQCYTDSKNGENSNSFIEAETRNPFLNAITFYSTGQCENFFIHILNPSKCETLAKNIFLEKLLRSFLFIFLLVNK